MQVSCLQASMGILYAVFLFTVFGWWWTFHAPDDVSEQEEPLMRGSESQTSLCDDEIDIQPDEVSFSWWSDNLVESVFCLIPELNCYFHSSY